MKNAFIVQVAQKSDLERIINFLTQPEIDQGFCKPLSDRNISITNRVFSKYKQGVWLFAEIDDRIISCIAIAPEGEAVSFSTFACINNLKCKLAGAAVWHKSLQLAEEIFDCSCIEIDSWAGNEFINRFLTKRGFEKIKTYPDPDRRPVSVDSVLYRMTLEHNS